MQVLWQIILMFFALVSTVFADEQWAREQRLVMFGRQLADGPGYKVYSPDAQWTADGPICPARFTQHPVMSNQQRNSTLERKWAYQNEHRQPLYKQWQKFMDENQEQMKQLPQLLYQNKTITKEAYQRILDDLLREQKQIQEWLNKEYKRIEIESEQFISESNPVFNLYLEHEVVNPQATIIPLNKGVPTAEFIAKLNETLRPFLNRCGNLENIFVHHFYKDEYELDAERSWRWPERGVIVYSYQLLSGSLEVIPPRASLDDNGIAYNYDPSENPDLTLQGFVEHKKDVLTVNAFYRKDHYNLQTRKPGIVYKYDEFWSKYHNFDVPRRIFDGDFKLYKDSAKFKMYFNSYADLYSNRCKDYVKEFKKYLIPSSEKISTTYYMDGHQESQFRDTYEEVYIDKRFTPQWAQYRPAVFQYFFAKSIKGMINNEKSVVEMDAKEFSQKIGETLEENEGYQMGIFFKDNVCDSATMTQLGENLVRAANGLASLQEEGVVIAGSSKESDPPGSAPAKYLPPPKPEKIVSRDVLRESKKRMVAPPEDTEEWNRLMSIQTKRAEYIESKLTGIVRNTFNTRLKEDPYQERFDAIVKMAEKTSSNAEVLQARDPSQNSVTSQMGRRGSRSSYVQRTRSVNPNAVLIQEMTAAYRKLLDQINADYIPKIQTTRNDKERQTLQDEVRRIQQKYSQKFQREIMLLQQTR